MSLWTHVQGFIKIDTFQHSNTDTIHFAQNLLTTCLELLGQKGTHLIM